MKEVLFIIAPSNFRDEEYFIPREVLMNGGVKVTTVSTQRDTRSANGEGVKASVILSNIEDISQYSGIMFVGGNGSEIYFNDTKAKNLAKRFYENNKVVAAICIASSILANAGILEGKKATSFPSEESNLMDKGSEYTGSAVEVDGNIVTANGPGAAKEFGERILGRLKEI
jgi:protease I|tara:strand:- start:499 stop:1011 length:513 start_codon:yes stop_codon:yes gene_type:complete